MLARVPPGALMRRAAFGLAVVARTMLADRGGRRVALLVGAGDNGGDALWAGAELRRRAVGVTAVSSIRSAPTRRGSPPCAGPVAGASRPVPRRRAAIARADLVLDGVVGLSGRGPLRPAAAELVAVADRDGIPVLAVDSPSGVDPDTGTVDGPAVTAAETVTFGALKPVHVLAAHRCGPVHLVDIGLGPELPEPHAVVLGEADVAARWPVPGPTDDKYTQGVVGIAAGSATYPGAAVLASGSAVLATSGMVRYAGTAADLVRARWPEVIATDDIADAGRTQAWAVGPGIGTDDAGRALLAAVLDRDVPVCVDADGVTLLGRYADLRGAVARRPVVITPHDREFARVAGEVGPDRIGAARRAAAALQVTVLLKGNATVVADPDGRTLVHPSTTSWAATAGSGDVLTGIVGALLAAGLEPWWAAGCGAFVHARAAELAADGAPVPSSAIQGSIPAAIRSVRATTLGRAQDVADSRRLGSGRVDRAAEGSPGGWEDGRYGRSLFRSRRCGPGRVGGRPRRGTAERPGARRRRSWSGAHGGGQGGRVRARGRPGRPGRARRRGHLAGRLHPRRGARAARRGDRCARAVVAAPAGRGLRARRGRGDRPVRRVSGPPGRRARRRAPSRPPRAGAPQGRHRPEPQRRRPRRLAGPARRRREGRGRGCTARSWRCGRTSRTPTSPTTRCSTSRPRG